MPPKTRSRDYRRKQAAMKRDKQKPAGPKPSKKQSYDRAKRNATRAELRDLGMWL